MDWELPKTEEVEMPFTGHFREVLDKRDDSSMPEQEVKSVDDSEEWEPVNVGFYCPACGSHKLQEKPDDDVSNYLGTFGEVLSVTQQDDMNFFVAFNEMNLSEYSKTVEDLRSKEMFLDVVHVGDFELLLTAAKRECICEECGFEWEYTKKSDDAGNQRHRIDELMKQKEEMQSNIEHLESVNKRLLQYDKSDSTNHEGTWKEDDDGVPLNTGKDLFKNAFQTPGMTHDIPDEGVVVYRNEVDVDEFQYDDYVINISSKRVVFKTDYGSTRSIDFEDIIRVLEKDDSKN